MTTTKTMQGTNWVWPWCSRDPKWSGDTNSHTQDSISMQFWGKFTCHGLSRSVTGISDNVGFLCGKRMNRHGLSRFVTVCHGLSRAPWLWLILKPVRIMRFCGVSSLTKPETVWSHPMGCWRTWKHAIVISQEFGVVTTSSSHTGKAEHVWNCSNYQTNPQDLGGHHDHSN